MRTAMAIPETHRYTALETPVGRLYVGYTGETLRLISASEEEAFLALMRKVYGMPPVRNDGPRPRMLQQILATILGQYPYPGLLDLSRLTPFQQEVLARTKQIPRGEARSYAWLAQELGRPRAWRAVGTALARNPLPFIIPCHRVIHADGRIGAYSGGGERTKARLLAFEGVDLSQLREMSRFHRDNPLAPLRTPVS